MSSTQRESAARILRPSLAANAAIVEEAEYEKSMCAHYTSRKKAAEQLAAHERTCQQVYRSFD